MTDHDEPTTSSGAGAEGWFRGEDAVVDLRRSNHLRASLAALSQLGTGLLSQRDSLIRIAHLAVQAIPAAEAGGLILLQPGRQRAIVSTAAFVRDLDDIQYALSEGPCVTAAAQRRTLRSGSLGGAHEWPQFGLRVGRLGVHSVLAWPLVTAGHAIGAVGLYSHAKHAFDAQDEESATQFAIPAAVSVQNVLALASSQRLAEQLHVALRGRPVIDQAIGVTMSLTGVTATQAFDQIRRTSRSERVKTAVVAQRIIHDAVHRAHPGKAAAQPSGPARPGVGWTAPARTPSGSELSAIWHHTV